MTESLLPEDRFKTIEDNLSFIREKIASSARKSGRSSDEIKLMAVTKTVEPVFINHAIKCGIDLIGENKVKEFLSKKEYLNLNGVDCHLIGHLQTNKVRQIVGQVSMIQSVDSLKLASEISKRSISSGLITNCLIEVNVGDETSKTGAAFSDVMSLIESISKLEGIRVKGLMAIPPICEEKVLRKYFEKMHSLFIDISNEKVDNITMEILSMGMSGDYCTAIECGSNLVRIGSSIFGPRLY